MFNTDKEATIVENRVKKLQREEEKMIKKIDAARK